MGWTAAQAARLTGTTPSQVAYWARSGLVVPTGHPARYSFRDLVALRVVGALLASGLAPARVRRAIRHLLDAGEDIAGLRVPFMDLASLLKNKAASGRPKDLADIAALTGKGHAP